MKSESQSVVTRTALDESEIQDIEYNKKVSYMKSGSLTGAPVSCGLQGRLPSPGAGLVGTADSGLLCLVSFGAGFR